MFEKARFMIKLPVSEYARLLRGKGRVFVWWVHPLRMMIMGGMAKRASNKLGAIITKREGGEKSGEEVDEETLGGLVTLGKFINEVVKATKVILSDKELTVTDMYLTEMTEAEQKYDGKCCLVWF
ncbi:hypothetical protein SERLA73DRAFT_188037 [Serpula lacrymans var. lacrymans S7.3]|uniref:Uncharacterized protein n=2 Tax=Serpula lacrymans var. lacrymans TaxID=341189 RepID=F8QBP5_SERL3|nr:uncharacterized protein SERLADRAFT_477997 [Serpula lacrymans var. lacrymans S7.9]EGN94256.1 hypothetical protein SERLA73DRAFT_188037 [Serpula lacrymans var. lacrymans S7.3]EGO19749.1 hypothetical protein SERLADRAFT_477997 [Serpula lacrymans var. lacrymans S7.9]